MGLREQFMKVKENWLLVLVALVLIVALSGGTNLFSSIAGGSSRTASMAPDMAYSGAAAQYAPTTTGDFAPDVTDRVITKTASLSSDVKRGTFEEAQQRLLGIAASSQSIVLNQNARKYGQGAASYYRGSYQLKVPVAQYDSAVSQLKGIGDVTGFTENAQDITGQTVDLATRLSLEQEKLQRYKTMMDNTASLNDRLQLADRIMSEEQTIAYLQQQVKTNQQRVDYATVSVTLTEKQSGYANIKAATLSDLVRTFVTSWNALLYVLAFAIPWLVLYAIYRFIRRLAGR